MPPKLFIRNFLFFNLLLLTPAVIDAQTTNEIDAPEKNNSEIIHVDYEELDWDCLCIPSNKYIIIRSYDEFCYHMSASHIPGCRKIDTTGFNFDSDIIIGFYSILTRSGKTIPKLTFEVNQNISSKKYIVYVSVSENRRGMTPFPVKQIIQLKVENTNWPVEVKVKDYRDRFSETQLNCDHFEINNER